MLPMRVSYVGNWYNVSDELTSTANYGTNGGTPLPKRPASVPRPVGRFW